MALPDETFMDELEAALTALVQVRDDLRALARLGDRIPGDVQDSVVKSVLSDLSAEHSYLAQTTATQAGAVLAEEVKL